MAQQSTPLVLGPRRRIVLLTSEASGLPSRLVAELSKSLQVSLVGVVMAGDPLFARAALKLRRKFRKAMKVGLGGTLQALRMRSWFVDPRAESLYDNCKSRFLPLIRTPFVNSSETIFEIRALMPDLIVCAGTTYVSEKTAGLLNTEIVNVHLDKLPEYRNGRSVLWSIYNCDRTTGITVHKVNSVIDGGDIISKLELPIQFHPRLEETVRATMSLIYDSVGPFVREACEDFDNLSAKPQSEGASYTTPTTQELAKIVHNNIVLYRHCALNAPLKAE